MAEDTILTIVKYDFEIVSICTIYEAESDGVFDKHPFLLVSKH